MLNIMAEFDIKAMGFQSAQALHHEIEAKRLAFEDRAKFYADPSFYKQPTDWLLSKDYAKRTRPADPPGQDRGPGLCRRSAQPAATPPTSPSPTPTG